MEPTAPEAGRHEEVSSVSTSPAPRSAAVDHDVESRPVLPPRPSPPNPAVYNKRVDFEYPPEPALDPYRVRVSMVPPPVAPPEVQFSRSWYLAKLVFGSASIVASVVLLILAVYLSTASMSDRSLADLAFCVTTGGLALVWQTAEFVVLCLSRKPKGIVPGAHVALHLIIWLLAAVSVGIIGYIISVNDYSYDYYYYDYSSYADYLFTRTGRFNQVEIAMVVFLGALLVIHFILFVRACYETHEINSLARTRIQYVAYPIPESAYGSPQGYYAPQPMQQLPGGMQWVPPPIVQVPQVARTMLSQPVAQPARQSPEALARQSELFGYYAPEGPQFNGRSGGAQPPPPGGYYGPPNPGQRRSSRGARTSLAESVVPVAAGPSGSGPSGSGPSA